MGTRIELQNCLEEIMNSRNVYYQPPESIKLTYPCIVYRLDSADTIYANNHPYRTKRRYQVTLIDKNPDTEFRNKLECLPMCKFDRHYTSDNLNHEVFIIYY